MLASGDRTVFYAPTNISRSRSGLWPCVLLTSTTSCISPLSCCPLSILGAVWPRASPELTLGFLVPVEVQGGLAATLVSPAAWGPRLTCPLSAGVERLAVRPSLESLLAASSHMLKEVLDSPFVDPLKNLRLPRELNPNKKYSWMQKKEERVRCSGPCFLPVAWGVGVEMGPPENSPCLGAWLVLEPRGLIRVQPPPLTCFLILASCFSFRGLSLPV